MHSDDVGDPAVSMPSVTGINMSPVSIGLPKFDGVGSLDRFVEDFSIYASLQASLQNVAGFDEISSGQGRQKWGRIGAAFKKLGQPCQILGQKLECWGSSPQLGAEQYVGYTNNSTFKT